MTISDAALLALEHQLLWAALALGLAFGAIAQRTHFCTMGAIADVLNIGDWSRLRMWALAVGVAMIGFNTMVALGWVKAADSVYAVPVLRWASLALGGLLFGIGMVLASGCGSKTLVRIGGGNLKSLVVFIVLAVSALAAMRGAPALLRVATVDPWQRTLAGGQDLPSLTAALGGSLGQRAAVLGGLIGGALLLWALARREGRSADVVLGGLGIGGLMFASDTSRRITQGMALVLGVVAGSAAVALAGRSFRWEGFRGVENTANHLAGGALMGLGGVTAMGCTIGQGLSGLSTLSLGSFIAVAGIVGGAWLAIRWQTWRIERSL